MGKLVSLLVFLLCLVGVLICWLGDSGGIVLFTFASGITGALAYFEWRK